MLDIVSNCRVILRLNAGKVVKRKKTGEEIIKPTKSKNKTQDLHTEVTALKKKLDEEILPKIVLPELQV